MGETAAPTPARRGEGTEGNTVKHQLPILVGSIQTLVTSLDAFDTLPGRNASAMAAEMDVCGHHPL